MPRYVYSKTIEVMALELNKPGRLFRAKSPTAPAHVDRCGQNPGIKLVAFSCAVARVPKSQQRNILYNIYEAMWKVVPQRLNQI
jgi:hypothetical protein